MDCHRLCLRNDKSERIYREGSKEFEVTSSHCEEITKLATRQSIVSRSKPTGVRFVYSDKVDRHARKALAMANLNLVADIGDDNLTVSLIHTGLVILVSSRVVGTTATAMGKTKWASISVMAA